MKTDCSERAVCRVPRAVIGGTEDRVATLADGLVCDSTRLAVADCRDFPATIRHLIHE